MFESASGDSGPCLDKSDFVAENLRGCAWWSGKDCSKAVEDHKFSQFGEDQLMCHCPVACGVPNGCRENKCIKHCKVDGFSVEKLMVLLTALGKDVEIRVRNAPRSGAGKGRIRVAA